MNARDGVDYTLQSCTSNRYQSNSSIDCSYSKWPQNEEFMSTLPLTSDRPPYKMNCELLEEPLSTESLANLYYDRHSTRLSTQKPVNALEPSQFTCCRNTSSTEDFDFDQSLRRLMVDDESISGCQRICPTLHYGLMA
uniref:BZIP domain-containing protein n=1 Tax=Mesocestoides corti TaxID=53468 RepID=A0A5K3EVJ5_MESCO